MPREPLGDAATGEEKDILDRQFNSLLVMATRQGVVSWDLGGLIKVLSMETGEELLTIKASSDYLPSSKTTIGKLRVEPRERRKWTGRI